MAKKSVANGELFENKVIIWDTKNSQRVFQNGWFGEILDDRLELSLLEAGLLLEKGRIEIKKGKTKMSFKKFFKYALENDTRFSIRYAVYKDLKDRGLPTRTGFKFGCDFRIYERGVIPKKKGPKAAHEHTKWIVFSVSEDYVCSFHELSRAVRLAHNIRANMLWAVVDGDNNVTYYEVSYISP